MHEFADHRVGAAARVQLQLIERLHRRQTGDAAAPGAAALARRPFDGVGRVHRASP